MVDQTKLKEAVAELLGVEPELLDANTRFDELPDYDSVKILSLMVVLDDLGVEVPQSAASKIGTYGDVLRLAGVA